ncbi:hypothetical protein ACOZ4B_04660 [Haloferax prahovense]|uniref:hypothetical protein n=1 Tax=Haloferax prahovense TaxID=381852 RepID=UPI003C7550AD
METLRACVAYENAHQQRVQILRRLDDRAQRAFRQKIPEWTLTGCLSALPWVEASKKMSDRPEIEI